VDREAEWSLVALACIDSKDTILYFFSTLHSVISFWQLEVSHGRNISLHRGNWPMLTSDLYFLIKIFFSESYFISTLLVVDNEVIEMRSDCPGPQSSCSF
jgi:hypothetical protein